MKSFKQFLEQVNNPNIFPERGGYVHSPSGQKIKSFSAPGTKDTMPQILDTMPTPKERRIKRFWTSGQSA